MRYTDSLRKQLLFYKLTLLAFIFVIGCWSHTAHAACKPPSVHSFNRMYTDLKGITLFVYVAPGKYVIAVNCHGREAQCADETLKYNPEQRPEYLTFLTSTYQAYPAPLHRDDLIRVFGDMLRKEAMPLVLPGPDCKIPDLVIAEAGDDDVKTAERTADILTVGIGLTIIDTTKPPIAVLTIDTYRPDPAQTNLWAKTLPGESTAIPLDLPDDQISALLSKFTDRFKVIRHAER